MSHCLPNDTHNSNHWHGNRLRAVAGGPLYGFLPALCPALPPSVLAHLFAVGKNDIDQNNLLIPYEP
jgi:hypothetical protein